MLLLRVGLGIALILQGVFCFATFASIFDAWLGCATLVAGILLTVGFLTQLVAPLVALGAAVFALLLAPACASHLFDKGLSIAFAAIILVAIFLLGPGAFSIDARVFGRREIILPPASSRR